ncbi:unnamed protein product [Coffea canephora]|uniref:Uncharacterized protein n=1 Tax=Coffea canephora TaxID=49390 RepID=A0A068V137_COFCA|nr:unnamed protein product [Coffea canephora]
MLLPNCFFSMGSAASLRFCFPVRANASNCQTSHLVLTHKAMDKEASKAYIPWNGGSRR